MFSFAPMVQVQSKRKIGELDNKEKWQFKERTRDGGSFVLNIIPD